MKKLFSLLLALILILCLMPAQVALAEDGGTSADSEYPVLLSASIDAPDVMVAGQSYDIAITLTFDRNIEDDKSQRYVEDHSSINTSTYIHFGIDMSREQYNGSTFTRTKSVYVDSDAPETTSYIQAMFNLEVVATANVTRLPPDITSAEVLVPDQTYNGTAQTPLPTVTLCGVTLREGTDYTVTDYADNVNAGSATVTVTGRGAFSGRATGTFQINRAHLTITARDQEYVYNGEIQGEGDLAYDDPAVIAEKVTLEGLQGNDELTSIVLDGQGRDIGENELVPSNAGVGKDGGATGNYDIEYVNGTLTIRCPHTDTVTDPAVPATCTATGLTEGSHCSFCNEVLTAQETVEALGHDWGSWTVTREAQPGVAGEQQRVCARCGEIETEEIPALPEIVYTVTQGAGGNWTKGGSEGLTITVKRSEDDAHCIDHFAGVEIDGEALTRGTDYTAEAGSTVVTIPAATLERLSTGTHTVTVKYDDGEVSTQLTIKAAEQNNTPTSPLTGDGSHTRLWIGMACAAGIACAAAAVVMKKKRA